MGDGCNQEGIASEACSLAGHLKLGKLIALYDDNQITIDGRTDVSFTEDVLKRYEAYGWHVQHVEDGNHDVKGITEAIEKAKLITDKPLIIMSFVFVFIQLTTLSTSRSFWYKLIISFCFIV